MKKDIHPKGHRKVVFQDISTGTQFLVGSTVATSKTAKWDDGNEYPLVEVEISSASHPFYTGKQKLLDTAGMVDKFNAKRKAAEALKEAGPKKKKTKKKKIEIEYIMQNPGLKEEEERKKKKEEKSKKRAEKAEKEEKVVTEEAPAEEEKTEEAAPEEPTTDQTA